MKTSFVISLTIAFTINLFCQSQSESLTAKFFRDNISKNIFRYDLSSAFDTRNRILYGEDDNSRSVLKIKDLKYNIDEQTKKKKSIVLGVLFSALLPGAGEFYARSYLKSAIFFGVEVLAWGTFTYFTVKGDNKTKDFENFADNHWNVRRYARWLNDEFQAGVDPNEPNLEVLRAQLNAYESLHFTHTLPEYSSQQYYELIGKYQTFMGGWEDAESNGTWLVTHNNYETYQTAMFVSYSYSRQDANDQYNHAKIGPIVAILNHILSAADAAWTISTYNKQIKVDTGFRLEPYRNLYTYKLEMMPTFNMKVSF